MTPVDYEYRDRVEIDDAADLEELLRSHQGGHLRILGTGSGQGRVPVPPAQATLVGLRKLDRIERLEGQDLTCSVQPGVLREELDAALAASGLRLPCPGPGTIGGLFAADAHGSLGPSGHSPRSLILGCEAILAEGLAFRTGSRVVKSVAGFDLHKLFVGSRGRLFVATLLHLKLRPRPAAQVGFSLGPLDQPAALDVFVRMRGSPDPPSALILQRRADGLFLHGEFSGTAPQVSSNLKRFALTESGAEPPLHVEVDELSEAVRGQVRPSRLPDLLREIPERSELLVSAGGWFEAAVSLRDTDFVLSRLARVPAPAEVTAATPPRRGRATPLDPNAAALMQSLKLALDPGGVLV